MGLTCEIAANLNFRRQFQAQSHAAHETTLFTIDRCTRADRVRRRCGGGGASGANPSAPPARGTLLQTPPELLSTLTISALLTEVELPVNQLLLSVSSAPLCDIVFYHIRIRNGRRRRAKPPPPPLCS